VHHAAGHTPEVSAGTRIHPQRGTLSGVRPKVSTTLDQTQRSRRTSHGQIAVVLEQLGTLTRATFCNQDGRRSTKHDRTYLITARARRPRIPRHPAQRASSQNDARSGRREGHSSRSVVGVTDTGQDELARLFTLMLADVEFVASRRARDPAQGLGLGLGFAVQLCALSRLGFVPDEVSAEPPVAVARLGARLKVDPGVLAGYGAREQTSTDHLLAVTD